LDGFVGFSLEELYAFGEFSEGFIEDMNDQAIDGC
jgi:hypothetical protein